MNSKIYTKDQEKQIMNSVDKLIECLQRDFQYQQEKLKESNECFRDIEGSKFLNFTLSYNLVLNLIKLLMDQAYGDTKESLKELIKSDLEEIFNGPLTEEEIKIASETSNN